MRGGKEGGKREEGRSVVYNAIAIGAVNMYIVITSCEIVVSLVTYMYKLHSGLPANIKLTYIRLVHNIYMYMYMYM